MIHKKNKNSMEAAMVADTVFEFDFFGGPIIERAACVFAIVLVYNRWAFIADKQS